MITVTGWVVRLTFITSFSMFYCISCIYTVTSVWPSALSEDKNLAVQHLLCGLQVDCALSLVRLGKEREIPGLQLLCDDLVTMETLVYETSCELSLTLQELQQLRDIDKLHLLMKNVSGVFLQFPVRRFVSGTGWAYKQCWMNFKKWVSLRCCYHLASADVALSQPE